MAMDGRLLRCGELLGSPPIQGCCGPIQHGVAMFRMIAIAAMLALAVPTLAAAEEHHPPGKPPPGRPAGGAKPFVAPHGPAGPHGPVAGPRGPGPPPAP